MTVRTLLAVGVLAVGLLVPTVGAASPRNATQTLGSGWSTPSRLSGFIAIEGLSCASKDFCFAGDQSGRAAIWNGSSWTASTIAGGPGHFTTLDDLTCVSASFCAAAVNTIPSVDNSGLGEHMVTWNGSTWSAPSARFGFALSQDDVSCTSASFCMAISSPDVVTWNGSAWSPVAGLPLDPISDIVTGTSCASPSFCVAVVGNGDAFTWNGRSWSAPTKIAANVGELSCASASFCMAFDADDHPLRWNGASWSSSSQRAFVGGARYTSCLSPRFCLALSAGAELISWNGTSWSRPQVAPWFVRDKAVPEGFSCASASFCAAAVSGDGVSFYTGQRAGTRKPKPTALYLFLEKVEAELAQLAAGRAQLASTLSRAEACSISRPAAVSQLADVIRNRQRTLETLSRLAAPGLQAVQIKSLLTAAVTASIASDRDYQTWLRSGSRCPPPRTGAYAKAQRTDASATATKQRFLTLFNPVARSLRLRAWQASSF